MFLNGKAEGNVDEDETRVRMKNFFKYNTIKQKL